MQEAADRELLRQYAHGNSNEAFAALLTRHVNLVYSVALRKTANPQSAEEVTQAVFIVLAKKSLCQQSELTPALMGDTCIAGCVRAEAETVGTAHRRYERTGVLRS
jgi:hypothetical protein